MNRFLLFGKIVPERSYLTIQNARRSLFNFENKPIGSIQIDIKDSQVAVLLEIELSANIFTIRNLAYEQTKLFINSTSILLGGGYDLDLIKIFDIDTGLIDTFGPRAASIVNHINNNNKLSIDDVIKATFGPTGIYIQYALEDFSDGLRINSRNAMFLFYRSIESLRKYVGIIKSIPKEPNQWQALREILSISREDIDFIKSFADEIRHGGSKSWEVNEIERAEILVWNSIHDIIMKIKDNAV